MKKKDLLNIIFLSILFSISSCKERNHTELKKSDTPKKEKTTFTRQWLRLNRDSIQEQAELYISNEKDTIQNQLKHYIGKVLDSSSSEFYNLEISESEIDNVYKGTIKYYTKYGTKRRNERHKITTTLDFLEKSKDSSFFTEISVENSNEIHFEYQNIDNNALTGIIKQLILIDTIIDNKEMVRIIQYETLVDNFVVTPSIHLIAHDFYKTRRFHIDHGIFLK